MFKIENFIKIVILFHNMTVFTVFWIK